jgi:hypothetical protein
MVTEIGELIYLVRAHKVMLDHDLAALYGVTTKVLVQAVKRNLRRFLEDFMFQLSIQEVRNLKSQIVTSSWGGRRKLPYAFTEQGVAMLSSILRSENAIEVNIQIVRTFVQLRNLIASNAELALRLDDLERRYDGQFQKIFEAIRQIMNPSLPAPNRRIGFGRE